MDACGCGGYDNMKRRMDCRFRRTGMMIFGGRALPMEGFAVTAVCDEYPDRMQKAK